MTYQPLVRGVEPALPAQVIGSVLESDGEALDHETRADAEARFRMDFGRVRIHRDGRADSAARTMRARAFTYGDHIVLAAGEYRPEERAGSSLLRHELTHVAQQSSPNSAGVSGHAQLEAQAQEAAGAGGTAGPVGHTGGPVVQHVGFFQKVARFFGGGTFSTKELTDYLATLRRTQRIEDSYDSDNKAREVVRRGKAGAAGFSGLTEQIRVLLIRELLSGYVSGDDETAILDLLMEAPPAESLRLVSAVGESVLLQAFTGRNNRKLRELVSNNETAPAGGWSVGRVRAILRHEGEEGTLAALKAIDYELWSFQTAFDKWRYPDGSEVEEEVVGLRGNTQRPESVPPGRKIRIKRELSDEDAASVLIHESWHAIAGPPTSTDPAEAKQQYLGQEVEARVLTELYHIKRGLPPSRPGYRKPDGTVDRARIKSEIFASPHYNPDPTTRTRVGTRRWVGDRFVIRLKDIDVN